MRRILFVNLEGRTGGAEKSLLLLVRYLQSEFIVEVACPAQSELSMAAEGAKGQVLVGVESSLLVQGELPGVKGRAESEAGHYSRE